MRRKYEPQQLVELLESTFPEESTANLNLCKESSQWLRIVYDPKEGIPNGTPNTSIIGYVHTRKPHIRIPHQQLSNDASYMQWLLPSAMRELHGKIELERPPKPVSFEDFSTEEYGEATSYCFTPGIDAFSLQPATGLAFVPVQRTIGWKGAPLTLRKKVVEKLTAADYRLFDDMPLSYRSEELEAVLRDMFY